MKKIKLSNTGEKISIIGQGTWGMMNSEDHGYLEQWKNALRRGIELGMTHIDISESYNQGVVENTIGEVIAENSRDDLFLTGKLSAWNFRSNNMKKAISQSLKRLGIKYFDLFLVPGSNFLVLKKKYMRLLEDFVDEGKTRYIGVSNFAINQFKKAQEHLRKTELVNNQLKIRNAYPHHIYDSLVYYEKKGITVTVYSSLRDFSKTGMNWYYRKNFNQVARTQNVTVQQMSIAWLIDQMNVITLLNPLHIKYLGEISKIIDIKLDQDELLTFNEIEDEIYTFKRIEDEIEVNNSQWI